MDDPLPLDHPNPAATTHESTLARIDRIRRTLRLGLYETEEKLESMLGRLASVLHPTRGNPRFKIAR